MTSVGEARRAAATAVDGLAVQGSQAGGHSGTLQPRRPVPAVPLLELVRQVRQAVGPLPLLAAGGLATAQDVATILAGGADATMVGTVLLRTEESGASDPYKAAVVERGDRATVVTRVFTDRPARALPNVFTDRYHAGAPSGYPAIHHLTSPLRRAAARAGDKERINIWAGTGVRLAGRSRPSTPSSGWPGVGETQLPSALPASSDWDPDAALSNFDAAGDERRGGQPTPSLARFRGERGDISQWSSEHRRTLGPIALV